MNRLRRLRPWLVAALLLCAAPLEASGSVPLEARISLQRGRALLVDEAGVAPLRRHEGLRPLEGAGHLELAPGGLANLSWPGLGSAQLSGPASVSWDLSGEGDQLRLSFGLLDRVDLELRRGSARLDLPGAWRLEAELGVFELRALPGGGVGVEQLAGRSCRASWVGGSGVSSPQWIGPGERARLSGSREPVAQGPDGAGAPSWGTVTWPWGEGGVPGAPDLGSPGSQAWGDAAWPWGSVTQDSQPWERWDWPWCAEASGRLVAPQLAGEPAATSSQDQAPTSAVRPEPYPAPAEVQPLGADEAVAPRVHAPQPSSHPLTQPSEARPFELEAPTSDDQPTVEGPDPAAYDARDWRGLELEQLVEGTTGTRERSAAWVEEELAGGRRRISLPVDAGVPLWYFSDVYDYRLFPGAELLLDAQGAVLAHQGWVRIFHARPGREGARLP